MPKYLSNTTPVPPGTDARPLPEYLQSDPRQAAWREDLQILCFEQGAGLNLEKEAHLSHLFRLEDDGTLTPLTAEHLLPKYGAADPHAKKNDLESTIKDSLEGRLFLKPRNATALRQIRSVPTEDGDYTLSLSTAVTAIPQHRIGPPPKAPSIWRRIFSFYPPFAREIRAYEAAMENHRKMSAQNALLSGDAARTSFETALAAEDPFDQKERDRWAAKELEQKVQKAKDLARTAMDINAKFADRDHRPGYKKAQDAYLSGMEIKIRLLNELSGKNPPRPEDLTQELGRILLAESLKSNADAHNARNPKLENPLYAAAEKAGVDFDQVAQEMSKTDAAQQLSRMTPAELLQTLADPRSMQAHSGQASMQCAILPPAGGVANNGSIINDPNIPDIPDIPDFDPPSANAAIRS